MGLKVSQFGLFRFQFRIFLIMYFSIQNSPSVSFVVSYNLKTFVVRVCSYVLWNPQRLSAHSFKKCSRTKFEMFLFESSGNSLEENIHFMSQEITVSTGKIHSTWLNPGNFLKMIFLFLSLWRRWNEWGLNWAERLHIFCTYKCTIF